MKFKLSLFEIFSLAWMELVLFGLFLALLKLFYMWMIIAFMVFQIGALMFLIKQKYIEIRKSSKGDWIVLIFLIVFSLILSFTTSPTIYGGRDEGSLSIAGILISQDHSIIHKDKLTSQFGEIYQTEKAYNFPGFYYWGEDKIRSQFLPGYAVWIAIVYALSGLGGLIFVNFIPYIIFIFSFYLILRQFFLKSYVSYVATFLLMSFFPVTVFYKFSLTEIFFSSFLWIGIYFLVRYFKEKDFNFFLLANFSWLILPYVRIEALLFYFMLGVFLYLFYFRDFIKVKIGYCFLILFFSVFSAMAINFNFYFDTFKGVLEVKNNTEISDDPTWGEEGFSLIPDDWEDLYLGKVMWTYAVLPLVLFGLYSIGSRFLKVIKVQKEGKKIREKLGSVSNELKQSIFIAFVLCPSLVYLIDPNISADHPWMLRRFIFAVIPLMIFYFVYWFNKKSKKIQSVFVIISILFIGYNIYLMAPFLFNKFQNEGLLKQTEQLVSDYSQDDLLLFSPNSSSNEWSLMSEPVRVIYKKQAVYFFNQDDFSKLDLDKFSNVYLFSSKDDLMLFDKLDKELVNTKKIDNQFINFSKDPFERPFIKKTETEILIYKLK
ncbi:MAG: hypothetical protein KAT32_00015 [Candidatus Moranbacteria bacterium]|nr:hypothetical protein [Candidatus Moranbacteria bacterium]